jgi:hypothetical protein
LRAEKYLLRAAAAQSFRALSQCEIQLTHDPALSYVIGAKNSSTKRHSLIIIQINAARAYHLASNFDDVIISRTLSKKVM